jgi:hypothetical protein
VLPQAEAGAEITVPALWYSNPVSSAAHDQTKGGDDQWIGIELLSWQQEFVLFISSTIYIYIYICPPQEWDIGSFVGMRQWLRASLPVLSPLVSARD